MHSNAPLSKESGVYVSRPELFLQAQVCYMKWFTPMVPTPATLPSVFQPGPLAPYGAPNSQLTEEDKTQGWFTDGSAQHTRTTKKRRAIALQPFSGSSLKNSGHRKSSQCTELPAVHLVEYFGRRNGQICNYIVTI